MQISKRRRILRSGDRPRGTCSSVFPCPLTDQKALAVFWKAWNSIIGGKCFFSPLNSIFLDRPRSSLLTLKIFGVNSVGTFYSFIFLQLMLPVGLCTLAVFLLFFFFPAWSTLHSDLPNREFAQCPPGSCGNAPLSGVCGSVSHELVHHPLP